MALEISYSSFSFSSSLSSSIAIFLRSLAPHWIVFFGAILAVEEDVLIPCNKPCFESFRKNFYACDLVYGHDLVLMYLYILFQFFPYSVRPSKNFLCSSSVHLPSLYSPSSGFNGLCSFGDSKFDTLY